jgi:hypothetical protein
MRSNKAKDALGASLRTNGRTFRESAQARCEAIFPRALRTWKLLLR